MNGNDISYIREQLNVEKERIARINELLQSEDVKEILELRGVRKKKSYTLNEWKVISKVLEKYQLEHNNDIYVCTGAYCTKCVVFSFQEFDYRITKCDFDSSLVEYREYKNIETGKVVRAYSSMEYVRSYARRNAILINDFESSVTVLNPTNFGKKDNGYEKVRREYIIEALEHGDDAAKKLILDRYPLINSSYSKK